MKLLTKTLPQVGQLVRQGSWFSPAVLLALFSLEFFGRQSVNDSYDTLGAGTLVLLVALVAIRHRIAPLGWVQYAGRQVWKLSRFADHFKIDFGPDLRGTPPIPRRLPFSVHLAIIVLSAWAITALAAWSYLPNSWRSYAVQGSYIFYLVGMLTLWGLLFAGALGGVYFPFMLFNYLFPRTMKAQEEPRMSRGQLGFLLGYVSAVLLMWWLLPLWIVPALFAVAIVGIALLGIWPRKPDVQFIWRAEGDRRVWSVTTPRLLWITTTVTTLLLAASILTSTGGQMLGKPDFDMPITVFLGSFVAWLTPGIYISASLFLFMLWKHNPSRHCRNSVHFSGSLAEAVQPRIRRIVRNWGWTVRFDPEKPEETDVRVRLVEPLHSQAKEFDPHWPLALSLDDLEEGSVRERIERRDEIQKRRLLLRGLGKIFRYAKGRHFAGGTGFWLAPHLWFMPGLARDEMDDERDDSAFLAQTVGPPFHEVMERSVRQYLYRMLRALQIDLIFIEDGIDFRKVKKTLRVMFEIYDKAAGKKRAEEVHFLGLPKIKVLIHDFELDDPFRSETYPEPRFEDIGRARILHVFRDRGEQEEYLEPPFDFSHSPAPMFA